MPRGRPPPPARGAHDPRPSLWAAAAGHRQRAVSTDITQDPGSGGGGRGRESATCAKQAGQPARPGLAPTPTPGPDVPCRAAWSLTHTTPLPGLLGGGGGRGPEAQHEGRAWPRGVGVGGAEPSCPAETPSQGPNTLPPGARQVGAGLSRHLRAQSQAGVGVLQTPGAARLKKSRRATARFQKRCSGKNDSVPTGLLRLQDPGTSHLVNSKPSQSLTAETATLHFTCSSAGRAHRW